MSKQQDEIKDQYQATIEKIKAEKTLNKAINDWNKARGEPGIEAWDEAHEVYQATLAKIGTVETYIAKEVYFKARDKADKEWDKAYDKADKIYEATLAKIERGEL